MTSAVTRIMRVFVCVKSPKRMPVFCVDVIAKNGKISICLPNVSVFVSRSRSTRGMMSSHGRMDKQKRRAS